MFVLRAVFLLALLFLLALFGAWLATKDRKYLRLAGRTIQVDQTRNGWLHVRNQGWISARFARRT